MIAVMAKILLIDDEEELLDLFHEVLQNVGHSVCKTKCWDDAGHLFDDGIKVDLIVGDVYTLGHDAFTFIRSRVHAQHDLPPAILITGSCSDDDLQHASTLAYAVLSKPFSNHVLIEEVSRCLARRKMS